MALPPPALSLRLGDVNSSPVRDILELTQRAEVISFAGGLPAPELFPAELIADAFARALAPAVAARALQYSSTEGDPALRALLAERFGWRGLACASAPCSIPSTTSPTTSAAAGSRATRWPASSCS